MGNPEIFNYIFLLDNVIIPRIHMSILKSSFRGYTFNFLFIKIESSNNFFFLKQLLRQINHFPQLFLSKGNLSSRGTVSILIRYS